MSSPTFSLHRESPNQAVDWDAVDDELDKIPAELKDPRFDSLRHVLNILSAVDAEAALDELRGQRDTIEGLVDEVVQGYHNGFNKAIHNYSQILQLFSNCKTHVNTLRSSLEQAKVQLGSQSRSLQQQWRRSVILGDTLRLLTDAQSVVGVPDRLGQLEQSKDWVAAVNLLLTSCNKLARQELSGVGALHDLKQDMAHWRTVLQARIVTAILEDLFISRANDHKDAATKDSFAPKTPPGHTESTLSTDSRAGTPASGRSRTQKLHQKSSAAKTVKTHTLPTLLDCLVKLGGVAEAQVTLHQRLPTEVMSVIIYALQSQTAANSQLLPRPGGAAAYTASAAGTAIQATVDRVFYHCLQMLKSLMQTFRLFAEAPASPGSAGMDLLNKHRATPEVQALPSASNASTYVIKETQFAWDCIQTQCQKLLTALLQGQPGASATSQAEKTGVWLNKEATNRSADTPQLTFKFQAQTQDISSNSSLTWQIAASPLHTTDEASLLRQALAGSESYTGIYLAPLLYRPTLQFVDASGRLLSTSEQNVTSGWFSRDESGKVSAARAGSLQAFMESFVSEKFLPEVYLDFRGQCTHMLEDADAMKSHAVSSASGAAKGRPVVHAALQAEKLVKQLVGWAAQMPLFATLISGVAENTVGRVLDAFQTRINSLLGDSLSRTFAENASLAQQMAAEPAALLLHSPVAFFVGKPTDTTDAFQKAVQQTGFGTGEEAAQVAVLTQLAQAQPIHENQLISDNGDVQRLLSLATMIGSLEYLADAIQQAGSCQRPEQLDQVEVHSAGQARTRRERKAATYNLTEGLSHLVTRYRALAGQCLRALRVEMHLLVMHHLHSLVQSNFNCTEEESKDVEECISVLSRAIIRADEALQGALLPSQRSYVFADTGLASTHYAVWLLPDIQDWNQHGVKRISRMLTVLQPPLSSVGRSSDVSAKSDANKSFERARAYYGLLLCSPEALIRAAADQPTKFSLAEYTALLQANVAGRSVTADHKMLLAKVIGSSTRRSVAAATLGPALLAFRRGTNL